ncbi:hypothetical protein CRUP_026924 [Coryphaenoides rupestris]|nr:hypothetical protein CRUP_026924 [Coryphaenoides rupestris]
MREGGHLLVQQAVVVLLPLDWERLVGGVRGGAGPGSSQAHAGRPPAPSFLVTTSCLASGGGASAVGFPGCAAAARARLLAKTELPMPAARSAATRATLSSMSLSLRRSASFSLWLRDSSTCSTA